MKPSSSARKWLEKKARKGVFGYPVGTLAYYGPDNRRASKVAVCIIPFPEAEASQVQRWFAEEGDIRSDERIAGEIVRFLREQGARSVAVTSTIIGCPHEEGIDYPDGEACPRCPFWAGRDRWAAEFE